ncbi:hypothetical protein [Streptomyces sp. SCUT-3]|uniref:hypothetical protein n=1 Tax=Streptomyces sp. SCUT-3 TaxID=2684469 RepID=UPI0021753568|nr:hypothetical protein [Streptomyces sp. SCUT-3]
MPSAVPRPPGRAPGRAAAAVRGSLRSAATALRAWPAARWLAAAGGALLTAAVVGFPTAVIPSPLFGREVPVQWWNYPALVATAVLGGIVIATYVRTPYTGAEARFDGGNGERPEGSDGDDDGDDRGTSRLGAVGGVLSFFAVGCPVCNKVVLVLLGTSGAMTVWAPVQPVIAVASVLFMGVAAVRRLSGEVACPVRPTVAAGTAGTAAPAGARGATEPAEPAVGVSATGN